MSVVSKNPFDLLDDDGDSSPAPVTKSTPQATAAAKKTPNAASDTVQRNVPGSAPRGGGQRGGRYPSRGGPRNVYREDNGPRNTGPDPASGTMEGMEGPGGFEGERVAPPKRSHHGPDKHTKGPREFRENRRDGAMGDRRARGGFRGGKVPAGGGERRQFERRSGGLPDSQKKVDQGWGSNDGPRELDAEEEGEKDAQAEENAPQTPAPEEGGWGNTEADEATKSGGFGADAAEETPAEPEEVQKSYEQYLAEKAEQALQFGKKEGRQVTAETLEGKAFVREGIDDFFSGKEKTAGKSRAPKKEKVFIEVDGQFAAPPRSGRGGDRGGRGGGRGRGGDRGTGRGRGAPRGRGGYGGSRAPQAGLDGSDDRAFPALGA